MSRSADSAASCPPGAAGKKGRALRGGALVPLEAEGPAGRAGLLHCTLVGRACGSTWAGRALPLCCTRVGHGRAGPRRTAPLLSRPTPIPHSGRARPLHSSAVHSGQAGRTRLQHSAGWAKVLAQQIFSKLGH